MALTRKKNCLKNRYFSQANEKAGQFGRVSSLVSSVSCSWGLHWMRRLTQDLRYMVRLDIYRMVLHTLENPTTGCEFIEEKIELPKV